MPFDDESKKPGRSKVEALVNVQSVERPVRSPGHAFNMQPAPSTCAILSRSAEPLSRDQLTVTLAECPGALEDSMRVIDARIPCDPCGEIDLLAVDRVYRLTIIDVETTLGEWLLLRGVSHVDWIARNMANVRRMYPELRIDFSRPPRLLLIAPRFSPFLRSAVRQMAQPEITCVRYHGVDLSSGAGIFFEPVGGDID